MQFDFKELSKCPVDGFLWAIAERPKEALATIGCSVYEALFAAEHGNDVPQEDMVDPVSELAIMRAIGILVAYHHSITIIIMISIAPLASNSYFWNMANRAAT